MTTIENPQYDRATCYFCLSEETEVLEEHHIVPRRFGGGDEDENLVLLCPTCHSKIERLYGRRFYTELGAADDVNESDGFDADDVETGTTKAQRDRIDNVLSTIAEKERRTSGLGVTVKSVVSVLTEDGEDREDVLAEIEKLKTKGDLYEPKKGMVSTT